MIVTTRAGSQFLVDTDAKTITVRKMDRISRGSYRYLRLRLGEPMELMFPPLRYISTGTIVSIEEA
jgi:hypothetical protein